MKSNKAYIFGALIITLSIIIIGVSASYAYFVNEVETKNPTNTGLSATSGDLVINFTTSSLINADAASLINDSEVTSKAHYTGFAIDFPSNAKAASASYNLYLTDIKMTSNFKSSYLKWALYDGNESVATGDFSGVTLSNLQNGLYDASNVALLNNRTVSRGTTTNYKLYIWLSNDPNNNQTQLLEGSISAKVAFKAVSN